MDIAEFNENKPGRIIKALQGYEAFVPNPLPPDIKLSWSLVKEISDAERNLSRLESTVNFLPNPKLLINPFVRREAVLSSQIEGTQASLSDLFYFEALKTTEKDLPDVKEVSNYAFALESIFEEKNNTELTLEFLKELHKKLFRNTNKGFNSPGEFRKSQNWIGPKGCTLNEAFFVPPPPEEMKNALKEFEKYLITPSHLPALINIALIHYQFETIHPFNDGNGRIGRILTVMLLHKYGLLSKPLLYLSAYFEKNRSEYYRLLLAVSQKGEWEKWIRFFLRGISEQSRDVVERINLLLSIRQRYRNKLQAVRSSALLLKLIDDLFANPAITVSRVAESCNITPRAAQKNIDKLLAEGILKEITGKKRNRVYVASEIVRIIGENKL
ncbi:MAG: Fic family protein [Candidatus Schekmanbacteria bacterium]|nr:MAG: Fic family protein [Candidatus Schekmanbacteria bacterium]